MSEHRTTITVAVIGLVSSVLVAVISNWPSIFPANNNRVSEIKSVEPKLDRKWTIEEGGANYDWQGYWYVEKSGKFVGMQRSLLTGAELNISGDVEINGNTVKAKKTYSSDGNYPCNYSGQIDDGKVAGSYFCPNGGPFKWKAVLPLSS